MIEVISIKREYREIPYEFDVEVYRSAEGEIIATVPVEVAEMYWTTRHGEKDLERTGRLLFSADDEIALTPDEIEAAKRKLDLLQNALSVEIANAMTSISSGGRVKTN